MVGGIPFGNKRVTFFLCSNSLGILSQVSNGDKLLFSGEMAELDEILTAGEEASFPLPQTWHLSWDRWYLVSTHYAMPGWACE